MIGFASEVRRRAGAVCEYCGVPESAFHRPFHIEHIIARQHGGLTELENLALACWVCNLKKGPNLTGIDPQTGLITPLFHPRKKRWGDHFALSLANTTTPRVEIRGISDIGRTTVRVLNMNSEIRQELRYELFRDGRIFMTFV